VNKTIFVTGHRNPDVDSLASAAALAELRRRQGMKNVLAISPGIPPERARWLFERFGQSLPPTRNDLHLRVCDIMDRDVPIVPAGTPLYLAVKMLQKSGCPRLPVVRDGHYLGMLSPMALLGRWLNTDSGGSLTGRHVHSSIRLIARVIDARMPRNPNADELTDFSVYVAAMGADSFEEHLPQPGRADLIVIVGDRPEIHMRALRHGVKLLIVTGDRPVEKLIAEEAERRQVVILRTACDSATVIRRLKFCTPAELSGIGEAEFTLTPQDRLRDVRRRILAAPEDAVPVTDASGFAGVVMKSSVTSEPPFSVILVDHNEPEQSIPGVSELPVIEVVDHHRIGIMPTRDPIRFTGDVVGSTCTLVAAMFRSSGESLTPELAGLLEGGIVSDTLNLRSPTTSPLDRRIMEWLEKISGVSGTELMESLSGIDSALASKPADEVIDSDRKDYTEKELRFALSQVEESHLELLERRRDELAKVMAKRLKSEKLDFIALMVTDAVRGNSELLYCGDRRIAALLPWDPGADGIYFMPGVVSRKKQLLPQFASVISTVCGE